MMQEDSEEDFLDEDSEVTDYARGPSAMNLYVLKLFVVVRYFYCVMHAISIKLMRTYFNL